MFRDVSALLSMNFFEAQASARRSTFLLVLLFLFAVASLLVLSNLIVFELLYAARFARLTTSMEQLSLVFDRDLSIMISAAIIGFITLGSLYKLVALSSGGSSIALHLGGIIVPRSSRDPLHRKILNVVEEMAIASGTPVPQVYVLNEQGINAFAAGWKTTNAVIGITQGALERLTRDELQGVIAHEFSHIFNGDMRLNIRLIAVLHGILMIGMLGRMILRMMRPARFSRSRNDGRVVLLAYTIGASLMIVGYTGTFFGNWIKSLISRQREYLADASAVQFTRNSDGIADALKKIGGAIPGSAMLAASVDEYSHAYFARGDGAGGVLGLFSFSTHPPLKQRILRIQPHWDGRYIFDEKKVAGQEHKGAVEETTTRKSRAAAVAFGLGAGLPLAEVLNNIDSIGEVSQTRIDVAQRWHQDIPDRLLAHAENPYGAQALILAILLHPASKARDRQLLSLRELIGELHTDNVLQVEDEVRDYSQVQVLPLIDLSLPTLREMTFEQYQRFREAVVKMVLADDKTELKEWIVQRVVLQHLDEQYGMRKKAIAKYFVLGSAKYASELILSLLARLEHQQPDEAEAAFDKAKRSVSAGALKYISDSHIPVEQLDHALDELLMLKPPIKKRFLQACVHCIAQDDEVKALSYELTRAIASCLDCPLPPVLLNTA